MRNKEPYTGIVQAVPYYRVSTDRQGQSGLSLEGQQAEVRKLCGNKDWRIDQEFIEVESGKGSRTKFRKQLQAALALVEEIDPKREGRAVLVIYKLDRLSRNVHFLSGLLESGLNFFVMEMPNASRLEFHIRAAVAEEEVNQISKRVKFALDVKKKQGAKLGTHNPVVYQGVIKRQEEAAAWAESLRPILTQYLKMGLGYSEIVNMLNLSNVPARKGGEWTRPQLYRVRQALGLSKKDFAPDKKKPAI